MVAISTPEGIAMFRLLALRGAVHLETLGMGRKGPSATSIVKAELGLKKSTSKADTLKALEDFIEVNQGFALDKRYSPRTLGLNAFQIETLQGFDRPATWEDYQEDQARFATMLSGYVVEDKKSAKKLESALNALVELGFIWADDVNGEDYALYLTRKGWDVAVS